MACILALAPVGSTGDRSARRASERAAERPGSRKDGTVRLPNHWALDPVGKQVGLGNGADGVRSQGSDPSVRYPILKRSHEVTHLKVVRGPLSQPSDPLRRRCVTAARLPPEQPRPTAVQAVTSQPPATRPRPSPASHTPAGFQPRQAARRSAPGDPDRIQLEMPPRNATPSQHSARISARSPGSGRDGTPRRPVDWQWSGHRRTSSRSPYNCPSDGSAPLPPP
jgi:hypothetical protein